MIIKQRELSKVLEKLRSLNQRLSDNHPEKIRVHSDLQKKLAEERGEKAIDFFLQFLDQELFHFLHTIRIPDGQGFFQIDTLILSPFFILIIEVKNWRGTILFGGNGQVTRIREDGREEGFPNPVPQANLQRYRLQKWLLQSGFNNIPIHTMVVISFPSTIIKSTNQQAIPKEVIHNNQLMFKINTLAHKRKQVISVDVLHQIADEMMAAHTPEDKNILETYGVQPAELIKGVICDNCSFSSMIWQLSKMYCPKCEFISEDSYLTAINDYSLLLNREAKNSELRDFLQIDSPHIVKRLMHREGFAFIGNTNGRKYLLNERN